MMPSRIQVQQRQQNQLPQGQYNNIYQGNNWYTDAQRGLSLFNAGWNTGEGIAKKGREMGWWGDEAKYGKSDPGMFTEAEVAQNMANLIKEEPAVVNTTEAENLGKLPSENITKDDQREAAMAGNFGNTGGQAAQDAYNQALKEREVYGMIDPSIYQQAGVELPRAENGNVIAPAGTMNDILNMSEEGRVFKLLGN